METENLNSFHNELGTKIGMVPSIHLMNLIRNKLTIFQ